MKIFKAELYSSVAYSLLVALSLLVPYSATLAQQLVDRVVASIEGEPITYSEIKRHATGQGHSVDRLTEGEAELAAMVQDVVIKRLLDKEAEALNISVSNQEVEAYLDEIRRQNGVDEASFKSLLKERGIDWQSYLSQVRTDILKNRVVAARVRSKVTVVNEDIERYLNSQPALRPELGTRRVFELPLEGSSGEGKRQRAALVKRLSDVENEGSARIQEIVRAGAKDLGYLKEEDLREEIAQAIAETKDAELSEVVNLGGRSVVYFVVATITEDSPVDPVLEKEVSAKVFEEKFSEQLREFIDAELPGRYHVEQL